jgi:hypothetical protein
MALVGMEINLYFKQYSPRIRNGIVLINEIFFRPEITTISFTLMEYRLKIQREIFDSFDLCPHFAHITLLTD